MEMREISTVNMERNDVNPFNGIERLAEGRLRGGLGGCY
jgi:hypothetical protein